MSNDTGTPPAGWIEQLIRDAWPETAGVTLAALEVLGTQETFTARQVGYLTKLFLLIGAQARTAGDRAELIASAEARFVPQGTRETRIALRTAAMAEQHEIAWLRRTGEPPPAAWEGGTTDDALARYGWEADRDDPTDMGPSADRWHHGVGVPVRRTRDGLVWRDETP